MASGVVVILVTLRLFVFVEILLSLVQDRRYSRVCLVTGVLLGEVGVGGLAVHIDVDVRSG